MSSKNKSFETLKQYQLFEFLKDDGSSNSSTKEIDFAPAHWITYDQEKMELVTKFMPPPYDAESSRLLNNLIKSGASAPLDWPTYPINLKGHAGSYEEALLRLKKLEREKFAYTTGYEDSEGEEKSRAIMRGICSKQKKPCEKTTSNIKCVPSLTDVIPNKRMRRENDSTSLNNYNKPELTAVQTRSQRKNQLESEDEEFSEDPLSSYEAPSRSTNFNEKLQDRTSRCNDSEFLEKEKDFSKIKVPSAKKKKGTYLHSSQGSNQLSQCQTIDQLKLSTKSTKENNTNDIMRLLLSNQADLKELLANQRIIMAKMNSTSAHVLVNSDDFIIDNELSLPLQDMEEFKRFDDNLKTDSNFRESFMSSLPFLYNRELSARKTVTNILKKYLSQNVALEFTAVKKYGNKEIFKDTKMYECMLGVVCKTHKDTVTGTNLTEKAFQYEVGCVLPNAKDWNGGRRARETDRQHSGGPNKTEYIIDAEDI